MGRGKLSSVGTGIATGFSQPRPGAASCVSRASPGLPWGSRDRADTGGLVWQHRISDVISDSARLRGTTVPSSSPPHALGKATQSPPPPWGCTLWPQASAVDIVPPCSFISKVSIQKQFAEALRMLQSFPRLETVHHASNCFLQPGTPAPLKRAV